jgi:hypothetical protein
LINGNGDGMRRGGSWYAALRSHKNKGTSPYASKWNWEEMPGPPISLPAIEPKKQAAAFLAAMNRLEKLSLRITAITATRVTLEVATQPKENI